MLARVSCVVDATGKYCMKYVFYHHDVVTCHTECETVEFHVGLLHRMVL